MMKLTLMLVGAVCLPAASLFGDPVSMSSATRSAHLAGEAQMAFLAAVRERMVINDTPRGPFGLAQDADASLIGPHLERPPKDPPVAFETVVARMKIVVVNPSGRSFLSGGRWFRQGEEFPLLDGDREIPVRVESVEAEAVSFRNLSMEQSVRLAIHLLPKPLPGSDPEFRLPGGIRPALKRDGMSAPFRP